MPHLKRPGALERRFTEVYRKSLWGPVSSGPGSGRGATLPTREAVLKLMEGLFSPGSVLSFIDAPCGDMTWMPLLLGDLHSRYSYRISYVGIDIVQHLMRENRRSLEDSPCISYRFLHRDLTQEPPPGGDVVFCKDLINHLCFEDIWRVLENFNASSSSYLLITSNRGHRNLDAKIMRGNASRHLDLEAAPFHLPPPQWSDGYLALWELPVALPGSPGGRPVSG